MKRTKRFLSFLLTLTMLLTMLAFPSYADEEATTTTTTALTLDSYNVVSNAMRLEFSNTITEVTDFSLKTLGGTELAVASATISDNVVNVRLTDAMDIGEEDNGNKYILGFTATDGANTLTAKKLISYTVHWNDDFESYTQTSDLDTNYVRSSGDEAKMDAFTNLTSCGLEIDSEAGNKKMKIASTGSTSGVWINKSSWKAYNHGHKYYTFEADYEIISKYSNAAPIWMSYLTSYQHWRNTSVLFYDWGANISDSNLLTGQSATKDVAHSSWAADNEMTIALSTYQLGDAEAVDIFWDSKNIYHNTGTLRADGESVFGILKTYGSSAFYVDNLKIYEAALTDYVETGVKHCNVTTKAIQILYDSSVDITNASIALTNGEAAIDTTAKLVNAPSYKLKTETAEDGTVTKTNVSEASYTLVITPEEVLDLNRVYSLSVTGIYDAAGAELPELTKTFEFDTLFYDDFESYETASDLTQTYQFLAGDNTTTSSPDEYSVVKDTENLFNGTKALYIDKNASKMTIAPKFTGHFATPDDLTGFDFSQAYYTLEFDARSVDGCWKFGIPMFKGANASMRPYLRFSSGDVDIFMSGLFGFNTFGGLWTGINDFPDNNITTMAITVDSYSSEADFEGLFYDGAPVALSTDYLYATTAKQARHFGFLAYNQMYIDNVKAYRVLDVTDIPEEEITLTGAVIDSEKITLTYDTDLEALNATADIAVTADGVDYAAAASITGKTIVIRPASGGRFDMTKTYSVSVTDVTDKYGRAVPDYERKFRFKVVFEDDFSSYTQQTDLDKNYMIINDFIEVSEALNTENDYLYKLDAENDRLILNGTDGIGVADTANQKVLMPEAGLNGMSSEYWRDYNFEYTLSKDSGTYYRVQSYFRPWLDDSAAPSTGYDWISFGIWYTSDNLTAAQIIMEGSKTSEPVVKTPEITEDEIDIKLLVDENGASSVYKNDESIYEASTPRWKTTKYDLRGNPFAFRSTGTSTDKFYLDNLLAYKIIYIDESDLALSSVSYENNTVTADVTAVSAEAVTGKAFIAAYDAKCTLVGVSDTSDLVLDTAMPLTISNAENVKYVKAFVWGEDNLTPVFYTDIELIK